MEVFALSQNAQKMRPKNILDFSDRNRFRQWLADHHSVEKECWLAVRRGKTPPEHALWYLDAVEEALCFGWIDSTVKNVDGVTLQRFGPRSRSGRWTELNKERCRRLFKLGLMTEAGSKACPDLEAEFEIMPEIVEAFKAVDAAWDNFRMMHPLYQRVRIDNIQRVKNNRDLYQSRLDKLIQASRIDEMIGEWNDGGRLLDY